MFLWEVTRACILLLMGKYPIVCRILYIPAGAGFLQSTVSELLWCWNFFLNHVFGFRAPCLMGTTGTHKWLKTGTMAELLDLFYPREAPSYQKTTVFFRQFRFWIPKTCQEKNMGWQDVSPQVGHYFCSTVVPTIDRGHIEWQVGALSFAGHRVETALYHRECVRAPKTRDFMKTL